MSTFDPTEARATIEKAHKLVGDISAGDARWTMSVPARPDHDSDLILSDALTAGEKAIAEVERLTEALATMQATAVPGTWTFNSADELHAYAETGCLASSALIREADGRPWIYFEGEDGPMCLRPWDEDEVPSRGPGVHADVACFAEPDDFKYPVRIVSDYYLREVPGV